MRRQVNGEPRPHLSDRTPLLEFRRAWRRWPAADHLDNLSQPPGQQAAHLAFPPVTQRHRRRARRPTLARTQSVIRSLIATAPRAALPASARRYNRSDVGGFGSLAVLVPGNADLLPVPDSCRFCERAGGSRGAERPPWQGHEVKRSVIMSRGSGRGRA